MRRLAPALLLAIGLTGCLAGVTAEHVLTGSPGAAYGGPVRIVMEGEAGAREFEEVAIVTATGSGYSASLPEVLGALQREAASLGCDAVVRVRYDRGVSSATATGVAVRLK